MIDAHLKKLRIRDDISPEEEQAIRAVISDIRDFPQDKVIVRRGHELTESLLLLDGWMARTKDLAHGGRQISELQFAGDFTDLHGFTLKRLDHNVATITRCRVAILPHDRLRQMFDRFPHLMRVYWLMTNVDASIHREWTVSLGQRSAISRTAHLFCEIRERLNVVGLVEGDALELPLTQQELGECLGLTSVHINRTLQEMRRRELITLEARKLTVLDLKALRTVAEFNPDYLYLEKRPR
ncbi:MAG TPA: Crp/Fnr family transcriptional regulator [Sphingomicrobium sp.]